MSCTVCGITVSASCLKSHMARSRGICVPQMRGFDDVRGGPATDVVYFPREIQEVKCTVPGFPAVAHSARKLRKHFMYHHFRYKVAVVQEGTEPLPPYDFCGMRIPSGRIISHSNTAR